MEEEFRPGKGIWNGISSVVLDPVLHELRLFVIKKTLFFCLVRKVDNDKPSSHGNNNSKNAFNNLNIIRRNIRSQIWETHKDPPPSPEATDTFHLHKTEGKNICETAHKSWGKVESSQSRAGLATDCKPSYVVLTVSELQILHTNSWPSRRILERNLINLA